MFEQYNDVVTIEELAEMLGIGRNNAYLLLRNNDIKSFKNGRSWKIPKLAVIEYVLKTTGLILY
jgi:excisionase family DNA binding protein